MGFKIEMRGFDELEKGLKKLEKEAKAMDGKKVPFSELFNASFMRKHSSVSSFSELLKSGGYSTDADEFAKIPDDEFDTFIRDNTNFSSWEEMQKEAANAYVSAKLGF